MEYKGVEVTSEQLSYYEDRDKLGVLLPSVAVDGLIIAQHEDKLKVLLQEIDGEYALVGSFIEAGKSFEDNLNQIILKKVGLDVSGSHKIQIKTYAHPERDSRGHIITTLYAVFSEYRQVSGGKWFDVNYLGEDKIELVNGDELIQLELIEDLKYWKVEGALKFKDYEGHGYMLVDAFKYFRDNFYSKGDILNVYTQGYTYREAWLLAENLFGVKLSRTNQRRLIEKISVELRGEGVVSQRKQGKVYAQVYRLKTNKELLADKLKGRD